MVTEPLLRMSRADLDRLMGTIEVTSALLSRNSLANGTKRHIEGSDLATVHYGFSGHGTIAVDGEAAFDFVPHMLVVAPANKSVEIVATQSSAEHYSVSEDRASFSYASGRFNSVYGAGSDLFASLVLPIIECFDGHDQLGRLVSNAMTELTTREIGGVAMASALFKLILLALLRRSLTSANLWVEPFSLLNDPPIARAFAEMASRPAADFSVQSLCRSVGLSRSAFMSRFGAAFGESPMSILRRLRMRRAAGLLATNSLSIEQVAVHAGYQSRSSFTRTFRKYYGTDPSDFRTEAKARSRP